MIDQTKRNEKTKKVEDQRMYFKTSALLTVQWNMISRIDGMCHLQCIDFSNHLDFPFTLRLQLRWSKISLKSKHAHIRYFLELWICYYVFFWILEYSLILRALTTFLKKMMSFYLEYRLNKLFKCASKKLLLTLLSRISSRSSWGYTLSERVWQLMLAGVELLVTLLMEGRGGEVKEASGCIH